jgi:hypothetical protein
MQSAFLVSVSIYTIAMTALDLYHRNRFNLAKKVLTEGVKAGKRAITEFGSIVYGITHHHGIDQWENQSPMAKFADAAYSHEPNVDGFTIDNKYTNNDHVTYVNKNSKQVVFAISGTRAAKDPNYYRLVKEFATHTAESISRQGNVDPYHIGLIIAKEVTNTDIGQDLQILFGMTRSNRYQQTRSDAFKLYDYYTKMGYDVQITGHSLGGRQSMDLSSDFASKGIDIPTTVFEPAFTWIDRFKRPLEKGSYLQNPLEENYSNVTAYVDPKDPISSYLAVSEPHLDDINVVTPDEIQSQTQNPQAGQQDAPPPSSDGNTYHTPGAPTDNNAYWDDPWGIDHQAHNTSWAYGAVQDHSTRPDNPPDDSSSGGNKTDPTVQPTPTPAPVPAPAPKPAPAPVPSTGPADKTASGNASNKGKKGGKGIGHYMKELGKIFGISVAVGAAVVAGAALLPEAAVAAGYTGLEAAFGTELGGGLAETTYTVAADPVAESVTDTALDISNTTDEEIEIPLNVWQPG